ncbi:MAG TPA: xylulokinase [Solirubrobacteraceae bacterium]|nr:xylulokinase [Solirubrobacteraceae bacterium]
MSVAVGLDVGTSGVKALAVSAAGEVLARAEAGYGLSTPRPGWAEQDPADWWAATERVLAELEVGEVAGVGLSGQMHGLVALDAAGEVIRPAILWNDQRTAEQCREIEQRVGFERLVGLTGNRALTGFTAPKLLWLREHEPESYGRIARIMLPKDYVRLRLCGEHAIDVADASGTLLFDVARRRWSDEVLEALEVPREWLPRVLESAEVSGETPEGVPVAAGAGDQAAGGLGVGAVEPGPASVALGTSGVVFSALDAYRADPQARVHVFCHAVPDRWHAMGVMLSAAGSLQWFRDTLAPGVEFGALLEEAARWEPGAEGLTFLPYLAGERTPHADPDARGAFAGLSLRHDRGALTRAVLEGVAFGLRDCLDVVRSVGAAPQVGRASGGGARSELWLKIVASALELPVERVAVEEGAAYGAAMLGGIAGGIWRDAAEAARACVRPHGRVEPDPALVEAYRGQRERYRALYPALRDIP